MRTSLCFGVVLAALLGFAAPAQAQLATQQPPVTSGGLFSNKPRLPAQTQMQLVQTSGPNAPIAVPMQPPASNFSLLNYLPFTHRLSNQANSAVGVYNFPTQSQMPGMAYLSAFGFQRPRPAQ
jgi:hypothetical protein